MPVKYDSTIKSPNHEHNYTYEQIEEIHNCLTNIRHFFKYVKVIHPDMGKVIYDPYPYQDRMIDNFDNNRFNICLLARQSGKTLTVSVYVLHYALFNEHKTIGIVSNKEDSAKKILLRIKEMYEDLPDWLKPGVKEYNKKSVMFDNGTRIIISATSGDSFRGETINLLVMDEFAIVPNNIAEDFWASNYPTLSASTTSRVIIMSTPKGYNLFHHIYSNAEKQNNNFKSIKVTWKDVPNRDEKWAEQERKNLGESKFKQEYECEFLGSTNTVIDINTLEKLISINIDPIHIDLNGRFEIYEKPDNTYKYIMGVDTAKGTGEHNSTIQVLKILDNKEIKLKQVAIFCDNHTDVYEFSAIVNRISYYYNNAYIMVENNAEGLSIVNELWWNYENENLINSGSKKTDLGIRANKSTKVKSVTLMKKLIENNQLELLDRKTILELCNFVDENGRFHGDGHTDDLISALYWACYIFEMNVLDDDYSINININDEQGWGILTDINDNQEWEILVK